VRRQTTSPHSAIPTSTQTHNQPKGRDGSPWALRGVSEVELTGEREADRAAFDGLLVHLEPRWMKRFGRGMAAVHR
jgi:hypothetical protein